MTSERWGRVKEVFAEALDRSDTSRAAFLNAACGSDRELRSEVERLLAQAGATLKSPVGAILLRAPDLDSGTLLAQYRVENKLGEGGMGSVYRAFDTRLHRQVALKVLPPDPFGGNERKERLMSEARAASALNHPNIVTVYEIGAARGLEFIAMECVEGRSLAQLIPATGIPLARALQFAIEIADALAQAHAADVVHRDLKPANVMVASSGRVKLLDFGLAQRLHSDDGEATLLTTRGEIAGTPAYMSPEQAEGKRADERSDVFSFGAVLYEMLSGQRAFAGRSTTSVMAAVLRDDPPPLADVPADLVKLVGRCLRKDPARRFQHMGDVRMLLEDLSQEMVHPRPAPARTVQRSRRRWPRKTTAMAALLALAGGALAYLERNRTLREPMRVAPLTTYEGQVRDPTFSPDGKQVAFGWNGGIYVKLSSSAAKPLRLTSSWTTDVGPAWSPDGSLIAFRRTSGQTGIYVVSPLGGAERRVADPGRLGQETLPQMSWSPDGKWLAAPERSPDGVTQIAAYPVGSGERRQMTRNSSGIAESPAFSPDGRFLAYATCSYVYPCDVYVQELGLDYLPDRRAPQRITHQGSYFRGLSWMPDSRHLVYAAGLEGMMDTYLWRVGLFPASPPERVELAGNQVRHPTVARTGDLLGFTRFNRDADIWQYESGSRPRPFLASTVFEFDPAFSPDGQKIAYCSKVSGLLEVWVANRDGSNAVQLTDRLGRSQSAPAWSPDGSRIAFESQGNDGHSAVYVVESGGGRPRRVTPAAYDGLAPSWSQDGRSLYFSRPGNARVDIWRIPQEGGAASQLTDDGGFYSAESADGTVLYYTKEVSNSLLGYRTPVFARPAAGGREQMVLDAVAWYGFAVAKTGIYYLGESQGHPLSFYDFATRRSRTLTTVGDNPFHRLTVSPDGRTILFGVLRSFNWELMSIENFR